MTKEQAYINALKYEFSTILIEEKRSIIRNRAFYKWAYAIAQKRAAQYAARFDSAAPLTMRVWQ